MIHILEYHNTVMEHIALNMDMDQMISFSLGLLFAIKKSSDCNLIISLHGMSLLYSVQNLYYALDEHVHTSFSTSFPNLDVHHVFSMESILSLTSWEYSVLWIVWKPTQTFSYSLLQNWIHLSHFNYIICNKLGCAFRHKL